MPFFNKLRSFFATIMCQRSRSEPTEPPPPRAEDRREDAPSHDQNLLESEDSDDDPYAALSEITAPEPVERLSEIELARHPSLEQGYANSRGDSFGNLSELAAPEPVERLTEDETARHPSLERRLSRVSHH